MYYSAYEHQDIPFRKWLKPLRWKGKWDGIRYLILNFSY